MMAPPNRRNERERNRVKQVNQGFAMLRSHIPSIANTKKLSKVITLRSAVDYIRTLEQLLHHDHPSNFIEVPQYNHYNSPVPTSGFSPNGSEVAPTFERMERYDRYTLQENSPQLHSSPVSTADSSASSATEMSSAMSSVDLQMFADNWHDWR